MKLFIKENSFIHKIFYKQKKKILYNKIQT